MPKTPKPKTPKQPKPTATPPARTTNLELCLLTPYELMRFRQAKHTTPGTSHTWDQVKKDETP